MQYISRNENIFQLRQTTRHVMSRYHVLTDDNEVDRTTMSKYVLLSIST